MRTGIKPDHKEPRKQAVKHIDFKPGEVKPTAERAHLRDKHSSMTGPTMDDPKFCMKKFEDSYKLSSNEWNTEKQMT